MLDGPLLRLGNTAMNGQRQVQVAKETDIYSSMGTATSQPPSHTHANVNSVSPLIGPEASISKCPLLTNMNKSSFSIPRSILSPTQTYLHTVLT